MAVVCFGLRIQIAKCFHPFLSRPGNSPVSQLSVLRANYQTENNILPHKPKKPSSAFIMFLSKCRQELKNKPGSKVSHKDFINNSTLKWYALGEEERKIYTVEAQNQMSLYKKEHQYFKMHLSKEQNEEIAKMELLQKGKKFNRLLKTQLSSIAMPKGVRTARNFFVSSLIRSKPPGVPSPEIMKQANEKWKTLTDQEKEVYENMFQEDRKRYEKEIEEWKNNISASEKIYFFKKFKRILNKS